MHNPDPEEFASLRREIRGSVLGSDDDGYDAARALWNARFDRRPAVVVRCANADDVTRAVRFARAEGLAVSVKGGGHSYAGNTVGEDSVLVDLGGMREVEVDASARVARVQAGARWRDVDAATQSHGLATTGGTVSTVGVAGFTLGGGSGWLTRKHGLAVDNVLGATVVTAAGEVVRASEHENADLFWGIRGGSGNLGVVTELEYALHEVGPEVVAGQVVYPVERAPELLRLYRDVFEDAPDELMCYPFLLRVPPLEVFPEETHGTLALDYVVAWMGDPADAEPHLSRFHEPGDAILDAVGPQPYVELQQAFDAGMGPGNRWYSRAHELDTLTDAAIDTLVENLDPFPGEFTTVYLGALGGAAGRVAVDDVAYPHRSSRHALHVFPGWTDAAQDAEIMAWADTLHEAMRPHANGGVYVNLLADDENGRVPDAYGANFARLRELKRKWDPDNLLRHNHNIPPLG